METSYFKPNISNISAPFTALIVNKTDEEQLGDHPVAHLKPETLKIILQQKNNGDVPTVNVQIEFELKEVKMIEEPTNFEQKKLDERIKKNEIGFLGLKQFYNSPGTNQYEIETKKIPKLIVQEILNKDVKIKHPVVLTPTIESNDRTIRVNFSFLLSGKMSKETSEFSPGVKVRIAQKVLGESIISGLDSTTFKVTAKPTEANGSTTFVAINFDLRNAEINNRTIQNPEWSQLLKQSQIAYFTFGSVDREISASLESSETYNIKANFSFNIIDGEVKGSADKRSGTNNPTF